MRTNRKDEEDRAQCRTDVLRYGFAVQCAAVSITMCNLQCYQGDQSHADL